MSFLTLTTNMAPVKPVGFPSGTDTTVDSTVKSSEGVQRLSFTTVPATPPASPPNGDSDSESPSE